MTDDARSRLTLTGERTLPGIPEETYWFERHVAGYGAAIDVLRGRLSGGHGEPVRVLDSGSGEGYGTSMLAESLDVIAVGLELFADAAAHAGRKYPDAAFVRADATTTPFPDGTFSAVVTLQVIEHLLDPARYVHECARLLRCDTGATLVCATPNRRTFTPEGRPKNPFHIVEFTAGELSDLLGESFAEVEVRGLVDSWPGLQDALIDAAFAGDEAPDWAMRIVPTATPADFRLVSGAAVEDSLDLVAVARGPRPSGSGRDR